MLRFRIVGCRKRNNMNLSHTIISSSRQFTGKDSGIQRFLFDVGIRCASAVGAAANSFCGQRQSGSFGILMYHRVAETVGGVPRPTISVSPSQFRRQVEGLVRQALSFGLCSES